MNKKSIITNTIIIIAIIILLNLVSLSVFTRLDLSKGNVYSLSKASKVTAKNLEDRLVIKAYFSKNLPGEFADARRYTQDLLSEYQAYSHGKLRYEFVDPASEADLKIEAQKNQIFPVSMRVIENDKFEVREVYMGLAFLFQDKMESIPFVKNTQGMEYDITRKIKKITAQGMKKIAFFAPDAQESLPQMQNMSNQQGDNYQNVRQLLAESYEVEVVDLESALDVQTDVLIFSGVNDSLYENQMYNLDQFLMKGGNILFLQDRIHADLREQHAAAINSNLFGLLDNWGIYPKQNLITDAQCGQVQIQRVQGIFKYNTPVNYPFFPIISNVNKDNMITSNLDQMQMIFVSALDTLHLKEGQSFEPLLFTTANSGEVVAPQFDINIQNYMNIDLRKLLINGSSIVAGIYSGKFTSYYADNIDHENVIKSNDTSKIIYLADSEFIQDNAGAGIPGNLDFILNSVDYLASESTLISMRSRATEYKPLKDVSNSTKKVVKWLNLLLPSLILILAGIIRYRNVVNKRKHLGELYE